jgi:cytochrome b561
VQTARYPFPSIVVHWVLVFLVFVLLALGWHVQSMPATAPAHGFLLGLHISLGLTAAMLVVIQIFLRILFKPRAFPAPFPLWQQQLTGILELLIYVCMILMPISGYLLAVFSARPVSFWEYPLPVWGVAEADLAGFFRQMHGISAFVWAGLVVVHAGLLALNRMTQTAIAARTPPSQTGVSGQLVPVGAPSPEAASMAKGLAGKLRLFGWIEFWLQFLLALISGVLLVFATSGRAFSPGSTDIGDGVYWAVHGFFLLCFATFLAFYYTQTAARIVSAPQSYFQAQKRLAFWYLGLGLLIGLLGIAMSFTGVALSISLLIAKTVSQPPGIAITDPTRIIRALDVFVLLVNFTLLMGHFIGTGISLWLSIRASKTRRAYLAIPSKAA